MQAFTLPLNPPDPLPRNALETLVNIQKYVDTRRFGLPGLARGLRRRQSELLPEIVWLIQSGYVEGSPSAQMQLTRRGKSFELASENDADDSDQD